MCDLQPSFEINDIPYADGVDEVDKVPEICRKDCDIKHVCRKFCSLMSQIIHANMLTKQKLSRKELSKFLIEENISLATRLCY